MIRIRTVLTLLSAGVCAALLVGCAARPAPLEATAVIPADFSAGGALAPPARWWLAFDDPGLDLAVRQALDAN